MADFSTLIDIDAPPEVVFAHLVDPARMVSWMGERAELDATPGGLFAVDINGVPVRGHSLEVDPPHRVVISWGMAGSDDLKAYQNVQQLQAGDDASALYDCTLGDAAGTLRFAEFLRLRNGKIQEIRLVYDPHEFLRLTAPRA